jgi:hypothetical protein
MLILSRKTEWIIENAAVYSFDGLAGTDILDLICSNANDEEIKEICAYLMQDVEAVEEEHHGKKLVATGVSRKCETGFKIRTENEM